MTEALTRLTSSVGGNRALLGALVVAGALAVVWSLGTWASSPEWISLGEGMPIEAVGEVADRLDEEGIGYRLERAGTRIVVSTDDLPRARVLLAREGLPVAGSPGFELFDQPSWGMTDFAQRVNYRRALEGELERTLKAIDGVEEARVHLALAESSVLRATEGTSRASAVLSLRPGFRPDDAVVEGVAYLVASSVQGLAEGDVTVLDATGRRLSNGLDPALAGSDRQLAARRDVERYLETKAEELVAQVFGPGNATVRVAARLNFDRLDRTVQAVDPDERVVAREDRAEIIPQNEAQGASSVTVNAMYEATRSVETLTRSGARLERLSVAVVVDQRRVEAADGTVQLVARSADELGQIESLVRNAVGISDDRGDAISVVAAAFDRPDPIASDEVESGPDLIALAGAAQRPVVALVGMAVVLVLGLRLLGLLRAPAPAAGGATGGPVELPATAGATGRAAEPEPVPVMRTPPAPEVEVGDPEIAAKLLRSWMKES